jgi:Pectate lyase superfamily protein
MSSRHVRRSTNIPPQRIRLLAAGLLLWAAPAFGQGLPIDLTLPPASVIGRPSTVGPGQATAIPFAQLAASLAQFGLLTNPLTFAQFPAIGANTVLGSIAGGAPLALSSTQVTAMINAATASLSGALPAWPNNTTTFFRGDGTYATIPSATATALGLVKFDNSTITLNGSGQLQAIGAAATSVSAGTTTTGGVTAGDLLGSTNAGCTGTSPCLADSGLAASNVATLSGAQTVSGNKTFSGGAYFSGQPWFDVLSTAHSCAAADPTGVSNSTTAIQCHINYMNTTYGGGTVYLPPGIYLVAGGGVTVPQGVWLIGSSIDSTTLEVASDSIVVQASITGGTCPSGGLNGGIDKMSVYGYQNAAATQPAVLVGTNCVFNIYNSRVWFGAIALNTAGVDGQVFNTFICGYTYNIVSTGANWYDHVKSDSCGIGPSTYAFAQNSSASLQENHFLNSDFSCGCSGSFVIADGHNNSITGFLHSVFDSPIGITNARVVQITASEVGNTNFTVSAGTLIMSGTYAFATTTISGSGGKACASGSNVNFTNC